MCGIVGFTGAQQAAPLLLEGLKKLEYRGYDSAGVAVLGDGIIRVEKVSGKVQKLCEKTLDGAAVPGTVAPNTVIRGVLKEQVADGEAGLLLLRSGMDEI